MAYNYPLDFQEWRENNVLYMYRNDAFYLKPGRNEKEGDSPTTEVCWHAVSRIVAGSTVAAK